MVRCHSLDSEYGNHIPDKDLQVLGFELCDPIIFFFFLSAINSLEQNAFSLKN